MLNVPQEIRNQIYATGLMKQPVLEQIMKMDDEDQADQLLMDLAKRQTNNVDSLMLPWLTVAPLLMENVAISRLREQLPEWAGVLPEVLTVAEALRLAQGEYLLTRSQVNQLSPSLNKAL